jgi:plastocyanin
MTRTRHSLGIPTRSSFFALSLTALVCASLLAGCSNKEDELFGEAGEEGEGSVMKIDPATAATVGGSVVFEGTAPTPTPLDMSADAVCSAGGTAAQGAGDAVVTNGKLANVFVYVSKGLEGKRFETPKEAVTLDQKGCRYHPHVLGLMVGQTLKIVNSDATVHNVHPTPKINKAFNVAQTSAGSTTDKTFDNEEVMIPISCDIHGWMRSYVGVLPHPFYSVSGTDGAFSLKGMPPGTYTITAWHEKFGQQTQQVTVAAKESKNITFTFKAS